MKKRWLGPSSKMNKTSAEVVGLLSQHGVRIGVQNVRWAEAGAFTSEVSAIMAADIDATIV